MAIQGEECGYAQHPGSLCVPLPSCLSLHFRIQTLLSSCCLPTPAVRTAGSPRTARGLKMEWACSLLLAPGSVLSSPLLALPCHSTLCWSPETQAPVSEVFSLLMVQSGSTKPVTFRFLKGPEAHVF